jgi:hypothetical protein
MRTVVLSLFYVVRGEAYRCDSDILTGHVPIESVGTRGSDLGEERPSNSCMSFSAKLMLYVFVVRMASLSGSFQFHL